MDLFSVRPVNIIRESSMVAELPEDCENIVAVEWSCKCKYSFTFYVGMNQGCHVKSCSICNIDEEDF